MAAEAAEGRQAGVFLRNADLEMVARRGLVQRQGLHAEDRLGLQVEGVDVEHAGPRAVRRRMLIGRTGVAFRAEGLDLLDLVVGLGRDVEELGRQAIDLLLQLAVAVEQILWPGEVELGVVLQVFEEGLQVALEADLLAHALHLAEDAGHFLQAQCMDLVRRQRQRRVLAHLMGIPGGAIGQVRPGRARAGPGRVLVAHKGQQPGVGGQHPARQQAAQRRRDAAAVGRRHRIGEVLDRAPEQALLRVADRQGLQLRHHLVHHGPRLGHAGLQAGPHVGDAAVEAAHRGSQALKPVVVVPRRAEGLDGLAAAHLGQKARQAADLADRLHPVGKALARQFLLQFQLQDAVGDLVARLEPVLAETGQLPKLPARVLLGLGAPGSGGGVDEAGVVARVAERRGQQRILLELQGPLGIQPAVETLALGGRRHGGQAQGEGGGDRAGEQAEGVAALHEVSGVRAAMLAMSVTISQRPCPPYNLGRPRLCGAVVVCRPP
mmetsp:Transcript_44827/g.105548  ORF Transcript_44827/g.105548 Transcript_44827/m.105548 type:complete len:492 (-) Transcript_44827:113-1588(-)